MLGAEGVQKIQLENPELMTTPREVVSETRTSLPPTDSFTEMGVASALGLASLEASKYTQEIKDIVEWAKSNGAKTMDDILYEIKYLSNMLGNREGEKKIKTVARYVYLS